MLDDKANRMIKDVQKRVAEMLDALNLTPEERLYAVAEAEKITNQITEQYLDDRMTRQQKIRPIVVAAAVAFSLAYFDKWVVEIERKFPDLGK